MTSEAGLKDKARAAIENALLRGDLVKPSTCEACGTYGCPIEGHHVDYDYVLAVDWLCRDCHRVAHIRPRAGKTADKKIRISEDVDALLISMMLPRETYNAALRRLLEMLSDLSAKGVTS